MRVQGVDSKFGYIQYRMFKGFAVLHRDNTTMLCVDDKATIPTGEPGRAVSTGVRPHNAVLGLASGPLLQALDHNFHIGGLVPSVALEGIIPESTSDSFFDGQVHVTTKERIFQPSSPVRHGAETLKLLRSGPETTDSEGRLLIYSDGGPDHRITYLSVQVCIGIPMIYQDAEFILVQLNRTC